MTNRMSLAVTSVTTPTAASSPESLKLAAFAGENVCYLRLLNVAIVSLYRRSAPKNSTTRHHAEFVYHANVYKGQFHMP